MWSGSWVRGKTTTCKGNSGMSRDGMVPLWRSRTVLPACPIPFFMRIDGKVVLITGASEGIGSACAAEFARAGAKLSLTARNEEGLQRAGQPAAEAAHGEAA